MSTVPSRGSELGPRARGAAVRRCTAASWQQPHGCSHRRPPPQAALPPQAMAAGGMAAVGVAAAGIAAAAVLHARARSGPAKIYGAAPSDAQEPSFMQQVLERCPTLQSDYRTLPFLSNGHVSKGHPCGLRAPRGGCSVWVQRLRCELRCTPTASSAQRPLEPAARWRPRCPPRLRPLPLPNCAPTPAWCSGGRSS